MSISVAVCLHRHVCPFILHLWWGGLAVSKGPAWVPSESLTHPHPQGVLTLCGKELRELREGKGREGLGRCGLGALLTGRLAGGRGTALLPQLTRLGFGGHSLLSVVTSCLHSLVPAPESSIFESQIDSLFFIF